MLLDLNKYIEKENLKQITTSNLMISNRNDPNGLFSNIIFGLFGSSKWRTKHAFIDLKCTVLHPLLYEIADRRCSALLKFFRGDLSILNNKLISGNSGDWGINYFYDNLEKVVKIFLDQGQLTDAGQSLLRYIVKHKKVTFLDKQIVLPPQFRPMYIVNNKLDLHPLNDKYLSILNEVDIISITDIGSRSYKEILMKIQLRVFEGFQLLKDMLKGKGGVQRKSLLGKSMDFSARAVIVGDPNIPPDKVGVPFNIALSIFKPFIIYKSTSKYASKWEDLGFKPSILSIGNLINMVKEGKKDLMDDTIISLLLEILKELCEEKVVVMKRDPSLHRMNLRAFYPTIIFTDSLHINPLLTDGFNADFDGDQMAIYLPLTEAAQKEAKEKMLVSKNIWSPTGTDLTLGFKNDTVAGVYFLTAEPSPSSKSINMKVSTLTELTALLLKYSDPTLYVTYKTSKKTIGRAIVENITGVVIDKQLTKRDISELFVKLAKKEKPETIMNKMDDLMKVAIIVPTLTGKSINVDQFKFPEKLEDKKKAAFKSENPSDALKKLSLEVAESLKEADSLIYDLYHSGSRGNLTTIQTQIVAKGYVEDTDGTVIDKPVYASLSDGLTSSEFVNASIGGRKGIVDTSQMTAVSGYLTRQMVYCNASVKASNRVKDCGTKRYFEIKVDTPDIAKALIGRYTNNGQLIETVEDILNKNIKLRSPLYCKSTEMCQRCLGEDVTKRIKSNNIGILAAQLLGERGSQLTMRTFHCNHSKMIMLLKYNDEIICTSFDRLWDMIDSDIVSSGFQEEKPVSNLLVWDRDKFTKVNKIIRHPQQENTEMVMLRTNGGDFIISQDNHPHMLAVNEENGSKQYATVNANELDEYKYFTNTSFPIWQKEKQILDIDAYMLGIKLGEDLLNPNIQLPFKFIYYSDEDLSKILCGVVDGSSCLIDLIVDRVSFEITSLELIQQLHHILKKFNIKHDIIINTTIEDFKNQVYVICFDVTKESMNILKYSKLLQMETFSKKANDEKDMDLITYKQPILYTNSYVYDLETESHTLTTNGFWTHNTGGSGSVVNFLEEDSTLADMFAQDGNDIITKQKLKFIFKEEHIRGIDINEYLVQNFTIVTENQRIELYLTYDFTIIAPTRDSMVIENKEYSIEFDEGVICGSMKNSSGSIVSAIADVSKLLSSRLLVNEALVMKLHELYSAQTFIPMWALEILCSQLARNPDNPRLPYRLSNMRKDPVRIPIKQVALVESWKRGAAFENISNALHTAILNDTDDTLITSDIDNLLDL